MANFKLTISDKKGNLLLKELKEKDANPFVGLNIGNEIDAAIVGLSGKMKITGGSDKSGVPMRADRSWWFKKICSVIKRSWITMMPKKENEFVN